MLATNVEHGGRVWEEGHTVLLCWCESAGEVAQVRPLLMQWFKLRVLNWAHGCLPHQLYQSCASFVRR